MLPSLRHTFRWMNGRNEFDAYFAKLLIQGSSGVPTADEARRDYTRVITSKIYIT
jgi:hypothetical protein